MIETDPYATMASTKVFTFDDGERLFHSKMWVWGKYFHFIVASSSQMNLIYTKNIKRLNLKTTSHPQPYCMGWVSQGRVIQVNKKCGLSFSKKQLKDEMISDVYPLDVCDTLLGNPYMCRCHGVYESRLRSVIIKLGGKNYWKIEVSSPHSVFGLKIVFSFWVTSWRNFAKSMPYECFLCICNRLSFQGLGGVLVV